MATTITLSGSNLWVATDDQRVIDYLSSLRGSRRVSPTNPEWANPHGGGIYELSPLLEDKLKAMVI